MTSKKFFYILISVVVLLCIALVAGAKVAANLLAGKSDKLVALQLQQQSLDSETTQLATAKQQTKKYTPLAEIAKSIVPQDKNQAEAVREIVKIAHNNGISLGSITFPKSDLGNGKSQVNLSQLTSVKDIPGVYSLPITIMSGQSVSYNSFINFLSQLEHNRRTAQVTNISLQPDSKNSGDLSFTISVNEYIKP